MRIGIYLGDFTPDVGGGFTFQDDVFCAFADVAAQSRHQFFVMGSAGNLSGYVKSVAAANNSQAVRIALSYSDRRKEALKSYSPLLRRLLGAGPVERASGKLGLDFLWYVAGGAYEATDVPYVATVWDLQHRTMPWFPELGAGGTWDARELSYCRFLQRATYVITGTEVGRTEIGTYYQTARDRIRVLPHPTPRFAMQNLTDVETGIRTRLGLSEPYLLYPAQFWPHKNHANLLRALQLLRDNFNLKLRLVLAGSEKGNVAYVRKLVDKLGLSNQVLFTGFVSQEELIDLYRGALMLVYASFGGPENLPPLEAFALGCPVAAANVPGAFEQLKEAAVFFDPSDASDMAEKIHQLSLQEQLRAELKLRGYARASAWTAKEFAGHMLDLFDEFAAYRRCWPSSDDFSL